MARSSIALGVVAIIIGATAVLVGETSPISGSEKTTTSTLASSLSEPADTSGSQSGQVQTMTSTNGDVTGVTGSVATSATATTTTNQTLSFSTGGRCPGMPGYSYSSVNITFSVPPCTSYTFPGSATQISVLNSSLVFPLVNGAYFYNVSYVSGGFSSTAPTHIILNVTGTQDVTGNWTTGYHISYSNNKLLNITVQKGTSAWVVTDVIINDMPNRSNYLTFDPQQQENIQAAFSNDTVQALMSGSQYYVRIVYPHGGTAANPLEGVQLYQVNGIRAINIDLNSTLSVVDASLGTWAGVSCDSNGLCVTDPWDVKPDAGDAMPPFTLTIAYSGQWTANVTAYNSTSPNPKNLLYTKTFTGTGNESITLPWQSPIGGMYVKAIVQKSDGGNAILTATLKWSGTDEDSGSTGPEDIPVTVDYSVLAS